MDSKVKLVYLNSDGNFIEDSELAAVGLNGLQVEVADATWVDLPPGGELLQLPGRLPLGYNESACELEVVESATAMAALLPVGYTRALIPGYETETDTRLPLFGYTAVGSANGRLKAAAFKTDEDLKWNPLYYNTGDLGWLIAEKKRSHPDNRIIQQLAQCSLEYHCLTAQNIFYQRWEAGIPVSPVCNCDCLGCISQQPAECCPAPQSRIGFVPSVTEVVEPAVAHLENAVDAIVSFGQGCEGEPSLQWDVISEAIREIRRQTSKGTINMNSNAGDVQAIRQITDAGLDSIRVSLFSAVPENYRWYHRPHGYGLEEVVQSIRYATSQGVQVAINLLLYPGFTNQFREAEALRALLAEGVIQQIQLRNLNIDPELMTNRLNDEELPSVQEWMGSIQADFPRLVIGNYSRTVR